WLLYGQSDSGLENELIGRMNDGALLDPEASIVRRMSAVTLGRLQAQSVAGAMPGVYSNTMNPMDLRLAARWASWQMTGRELPPLRVEPSTETFGFLQPSN